MPDARTHPAGRATALFGLILVGLDESDPALAAQRLALELAAREPGTRLVFCHVADTPTLYERATSYGYDPQPIAAELEASLRPILAQAVRAARDSGVPAEQAFLKGDPVGEFLQLATQRGAGLIVVGSHGRTGLQRLFLGSFAENVVRRSPCPVLVVRSADALAPSFRRILLPFDGSAPAAAALDLALALAKAHDGRITLLNAVDVVRYLSLVAASEGFVTDDLPAALRSGGRAIIEAAQAAIQAAGGARAEECVDDRTPVEAIDAVAHEIGADVIVMGTHARHGLPGLFLGSTTERVLRGSTIPILTVRGR